jgi:hypothetical protein
MSAHPGGTAPEASSRKCPACGAGARRDGARFCATCGRRLEGDYFPTDSLRASYRYERRPSAGAPDAGRAGEAARFVADGGRAARRARVARTMARQGGEVMPQRNLNGASTTALAFVTYALVPYVGILFCPGALLMGGIGLVRAYRAPHVGGGRASALGVLLGVLLLCAHLLLWWILYKVPEWTRTAPF